ncbi:MAG TPA: hypothetical protein VJN18_30355 [Polyangiaceae bacterium]|nr:hypothetical protein [Polyangiaceae bacterium]
MSTISRAALALALLLPGCGGDDADEGTGTISVRLYGESFIEEGIPSDDVDDGWAISFSRFDVTVQDIVVGEVALEDPEAVDLSAASDGEGHELGAASVSAGDHAEPSFTIAHVEIDGSAEQDDVTKTFNWVFDSPTHYTHCGTTTSVAKDASATFQITVHADHLFYDSLVAEEPQLLFQPLADSDSDDDGEITEAELGAVDIGAYDPGNEDVDELWGWLIAQTRTLGHVDGEGHCEANSAD